jgi:hypothetical protein
MGGTLAQLLYVPTWMMAGQSGSLWRPDQVYYWLYAIPPGEGFSMFIRFCKEPSSTEEHGESPKRSSDHSCPEEMLLEQVDDAKPAGLSLMFG